MSAGNKRRRDDSEETVDIGTLRLDSGVEGLSASECSSSNTLQKVDGKAARKGPMSRTSIQIDDSHAYEDHSPIERPNTDSNFDDHESTIQLDNFSSQTCNNGSENKGGEEASEESEGYESVESCGSDCSEDHTPYDALCAYIFGRALSVRWPCENTRPAEESAVGDNEIRRTTTKVLNPELCRFCRVFFDTWSSVRGFYSKDNWMYCLVSGHYDTMSSLRESASGGCYLCALFLAIIRHKYPSFDHMKPSPLKLHCFKEWNYPGREPKWFISLEFWWEIENGSRRATKACVRMIPSDCSEPKRFEPQCFIDEGNSSYPSQDNWGGLRLGCTENSTSLVKRWLQECSLSHSACMKQEASTLPTRLIGIDCSAIKLCISVNERCSRYATLSHCWGKSKVLRLRRSNYQAFLEEIPYDKLCQTFRDSIDIARALEFSWLWIDSLCIIQGDEDDWIKEASRLATIYGLSSLNIAATAAQNSFYGCLFEQDINYTKLHQVEVEMNNQKQVYDMIDKDLYL